ncbi:putative spermidine/putrescine transport system permease protein [Pseudochelatococcus lubricantis]|uniref:Spermidine/putrescine transport system permease protein n=1 Tax=Pseudochelatococcus lubricantis TaxID=1538102 RepID=A0ABX0V2G8_9HYPH|nr:ABC transporter permease [Pseudochelatococcus lubricantis]NIJ58535.1 putative spermidine/putrescine transport system permease protein [Pseudochelatococcus lubricantis]
MSEVSFRQRVGALALVAPLALFIALFFVWPLVTVLKESVSDATVSHALPTMVDAAADWNRQSPPTAAMKAALVTDLRGIEDQQLFGDLVRRLNSAQAGFRTLLPKTRTAVDKSRETTAPEAVDLEEIDKRWSNPAYWQAIAGTLSPFTDQHLLAAVDLSRDGTGAIVALGADESANLTILLRTFWVSALVTLVCLAIGLPYAMLAAAMTGWRRQLLLGAVLLPLWTSLLVRTASWYILLQDNGLVNDALQSLGLTDAPLRLIFNRVGVVIAMAHILLPFMVLPIYSVLITIPKTLMPAAASLGAHPLLAFLRVLLPLSLRGVASGALLVFMAAIGYYITPALIGGAQDQMISSVIAFYATGSANWGMAAALGIVLLAATLLLYMVYGWLSSDKTARA